MSYDIDLRVDTGRDLVSIRDWNYTYNVSPMFREAFDCLDGIRMLDGMSAPVAAKWLQIAVSAMRADPEKYRAMNPPNGWGSYEGVLKLLEEMLAECEGRTRCVVQVS